MLTASIEGGAQLSVLRPIQAWVPTRIVANEGYEYLHLGHTINNRADSNEDDQSTIATRTSVYATPVETTVNSENYIDNVYLLTCKCVLGYYSNGDTCTACAAGEVVA